MKRIRTFVVLVLLSGLFPAQAEIYKWVDEQGRVHYGDMPKAEAETLNIQDTEDPPADLSRRERRQRVLESMQAERERKQALRQQEQADKADAKRKCARARGELQRITSAGFLFRSNAQGEREVFTDEERAQATARAEAAVKHHCGD